MFINILLFPEFIFDFFQVNFWTDMKHWGERKEGWWLPSCYFMNMKFPLWVFFLPSARCSFHLKFSVRLADGFWFQLMLFFSFSVFFCFSFNIWKVKRQGKKRSPIQWIASQVTSAAEVGPGWMEPIVRNLILAS